MADKTAIYENLANKMGLPSSLEVQGGMLHDMIFMPGSTMTWKDQAQAYSAMATRYGNELDEVKKKLREVQAELASTRKDESNEPEK
jgi:hypothetical protein